LREMIARKVAEALRDLNIVNWRKTSRDLFKFFAKKEMPFKS